MKIRKILKKNIQHFSTPIYYIGKNCCLLECSPTMKPAYLYIRIEIKPRTLVAIKHVTPEHLMCGLYVYNKMDVEAAGGGNNTT